MIQPMLLQAFASTPMQAAASQRTAASKACASCDEAGAAAQRAQKSATSQPVDELDLSEEAQALIAQQAVSEAKPAGEIDETSRPDASDAAGPAAAELRKSDRGHGPPPPPPGEELVETEETDEAAVVNDLSEEEQQEVAELKSVDREVRTHEQAHLAAAGPYAQGGPTYTFQDGPDGQQYAVGGEVSIDTSPVSGDPEASIQKAQQIRAAALAPASPSGQDQQVAAAATQMEAQALAELSKQNQSRRSSAAESYDESEASDLTGTLLDLVA